MDKKHIKLCDNAFWDVMNEPAESGDEKKKRFSEGIDQLVDGLTKFNRFHTIRGKIKDMWVYRKGIFVPNGESYLEEDMRKITKSAYSPTVIKHCFTKLYADSYTKSEDLHKIHNKWGMVVKNGVIDLKDRDLTNSLSSWTSDTIYFNKIPVYFDASKDCPKFKEHLSTVLSDPNDIKLIFEIIGMSLVKEYLFKKGFLLVGDGDNGKGITIDVINHFFGVLSSAFRLKQLTDKFSASELLGKSINIGGDISDSELKDTALFKSLTGRDEITHNQKYKASIKFKNHATLVFACNSAPKTNDESRGYKRRWAVVEFNKTCCSEEIFNKLSDDEKKNYFIEIPNMLDFLLTDDEMSGILNESIKALHEIIDNKGFSYYKTPDETHRTIKKWNNHLQLFIEEQCEQHPSLWTTVKELNENLDNWLIKENLIKWNKTRVKLWLEGCGFKQSVKRLEIGGLNKFCRIWRGFGFKDNIRTFQSHLTPNEIDKVDRDKSFGIAETKDISFYEGIILSNVKDNVNSISILKSVCRKELGIKFEDNGFDIALSNLEDKKLILFSDKDSVVFSGGV